MVLRFITSQVNVSEEEVIDQISREYCNDDREKGKQIYQEAVKVIREKTRWRQQQAQQQEGGGFLDNILDSQKSRGGRGGGGLFWPIFISKIKTLS